MSLEKLKNELLCQKPEKILPKNLSEYWFNYFLVKSKQFIEIINGKNSEDNECFSALMA